MMLCYLHNITTWLTFIDDAPLSIALSPCYRANRLHISSCCGMIGELFSATVSAASALPYKIFAETAHNVNEDFGSSLAARGGQTSLKVVV